MVPNKDVAKRMPLGLFPVARDASRLLRLLPSCGPRRDQSSPDHTTGTDGRSGLYRAMVGEGKATPTLEERGRGGKMTAQSVAERASPDLEADSHGVARSDESRDV